MTRVVLESLTKCFGEVRAVDGVDLQIRDQELLVLVGPSGCGKSTALRLIAGLETATSGNIRIGERVVNQVAPKDRNIAMVFQNYALYPHMNVFRNMAFGLAMRKVPRAEIETRVRRAANILDIEDLLSRRPAELPGGQRQRVALGRAIVRDPEVFLLDEPLSNLDARLRVTMRSELVKLHRRLGATMVYVTHDQVEAMTMGDRVVVMRDGKIQQVDTPATVYRSPANRFVAEFIGSPPMNVLEGQVVRTKNGLSFTSGSLDLPLPARSQDRLTPNSAVQFGIRPEDVWLSGSSNAEYAGRTGVTVACTVTVAQLLGADSLLELDHSGIAITARADNGMVPPVGDKIEVIFNMDRAHVFDAQNGNNLWALQERDQD